MTQPEIEGSAHGRPVIVFWHDGTKYIVPKVDGEGHPEIVSKGGDKLFAFESIVEESVEDLDLPAVAADLSGTPVDPDKVWKITQAHMLYTGSGATDLYLRVTGLAGLLYLFHLKNPVSNVYYLWSGEVYLQEGDYMTVTEVGAAAGNDLYLAYAGVQMNAP